MKLSKFDIIFWSIIGVLFIASVLVLIGTVKAYDEEIHNCLIMEICNKEHGYCQEENTSTFGGFEDGAEVAWYVECVEWEPKSYCDLNPNNRTRCICDIEDESPCTKAHEIPKCGEVPIPSSAVTFSAVKTNCTGCLSRFSYTYDAPPDVIGRNNYTLNYTAYLKQDDCDLVSLIYFVPNGSTTDVYDKDDNLIFGFKSEFCDAVAYDERHRVVCRTRSEEKTFKVLREPREYMTGECAAKGWI